MIEALVAGVLLLSLAAATLGIVATRNLFAVVVLGGAYSFLMATLLIVLDAVDVAMTEASVGAGISTVLLLGALHLTRLEEARPLRLRWSPLALAVVVGALLVWGSSGLPPFGAADTPIQSAGPGYTDRTMPETGIPNAVTSVLASYRGYDTLGETTVIFTAGIAVLLLLKRGRRKDETGRAG